MSVTKTGDRAKYQLKNYLTNFELVGTNYQITNYQLPITNYPLPIPRYI
ncbi:MAG: alpha/beta hydrolase [Oscillatoriales cyanobacterium RU_3_3]|nr:alpha/beta hydrolase [Oscillatoriales cyanobacterium RU_3_3]